MGLIDRSASVTDDVYIRSVCFNPDGKHVLATRVQGVADVSQFHVDLDF